MRPILSVLLKGPIEDAFIYRTTLVCWTFENRIVRIPVETIEQALRRGLDRSVSDATNYILFHSKGAGASRKQSQALDVLRAPSSDIRPERPLVELSLDELESTYVNVGVDANDLLDLLIFYDSFYLATDTGLYSAPFFDERSSSDLNPRQRIKFACYSASASLGSVAASCGENGLRMMFDEYGLLKQPRKHRVLADVSLRADYIGRSLLNFTSRTEFEAFDGELLELPLDKGKTRNLLTNMKKSQLGEDEVLQRMAIAHTLREQADLVFSWNRRLFVLAEGQTSTLTLRNVGGTLKPMGRPKHFGRYRGHPISAVSVGDSVIVETSKQLLLVGGNDQETTDGWHHTIDTGPIISLRSFPRSVRYLNLALASSKKGLWLLGFGPEDPTLLDE